MMFVLGVVLFASLVMLPLFLQSILGYTAESAGLVLSGGGVLLLFMMPVIGVLSSKIQARYLIAFGWISLAIAMYYSSLRLELGMSFRSAAILRIVQVFGLAFLFVPINLSSYVGMPQDKSSSIAGIVNFMRNIGSSVGTSMVTAIIARRSQVHQVYLAADVTPGRHFGHQRHQRTYRALGRLRDGCGTVLPRGLRDSLSHCDLAGNHPGLR